MHLHTKFRLIQRALFGVWKPGCYTGSLIEKINKTTKRGKYLAY